MTNADAARSRAYDTAYLLALLTIIYNVVEGTVSVWFGISDETLSLFGFGVDSFVEVISAIGIWHMVRRIRRQGLVDRDRFEQQALRVTGYAFYLLTAGLVFSAAMSLYQRHEPVSTAWGIGISLASLTFMWLLIHFKMKTGRALQSDAILADAACSKACLYLSLVLLGASAGYQFTGIPVFDAAGALLIAWFALREGREALDKAQGLSCCCAGKCSG